VPRLASSLRKRLQNIKLLLLDLDGVLTDGGIYIDGRGDEVKRFDVRDGHGVRLVQRGGIRVGIISGRSAASARRRARELGIALFFQGVSDKLAIYEKIKRVTRLKDAEIAYVGDEMVDLPILRRVGFAVGVSDGWSELGRYIHYRTGAAGGRGAVREVIELLLKSQGKWPQVTAKYRRS
jgi:3-deoxy-D-manno-octulosonate 8-phosphate phosphatase (KDO 8-P phosphatase)